MDSGCVSAPLIFAYFLSELATTPYFAENMHICTSSTAHAGFLEDCKLLFVMYFNFGEKIRQYSEEKGWPSLYRGLLSSMYQGKDVLECAWNFV